MDFKAHIMTIFELHFKMQIVALLVFLLVLAIRSLVILISMYWEKIHIH